MRVPGTAHGIAAESERGGEHSGAAVWPEAGELDGSDEVDHDAEDGLFEGLVLDEAPAEIVAAVSTTKAPIMAIEDARETIGSTILDVLDVKFKGSLTQVRYPDENDRLF